MTASMHSTLPSLYQPPARSRRPHKQNPLYQLDLALPVGMHNSYRTRILNPFHRSSLNQEEDKIPSYAKIPRSQRYQYPRRSLSMQSHFEEQSRTLEYSAEGRGELEEIDNVRINLKKLQVDLVLLEASAREMHNVRSTLKQHIVDCRARAEQEISQFEAGFRDKVLKLSDSLSSMRRETALGVKHNWRLLEYMKEEVEDGLMVVRDIEAQRVLIRNVNF